MGKTLTFWIPLLFCPNGIQIIVTPLNQLGKQQIEDLKSMGMPAIAINAETANKENYKVCTSAITILSRCGVLTPN
jgi:superfamily II DNA helicase RecQ